MSDTLTPTPQVTYCGDCGGALTFGSRFCTGCGRPTTAEAALTFHPDYGCTHCGGDGRRLRLTEVYCPVCRWLRPLGPDYAMPVSAFIYSLDAQAMGVLQGIGPLRAAAHALSHRIGRPWLESAVNGIRLGPDQLPEIFNRAVRAARILSLPHMPEIYISGENMWDAMTLGSETSSFVVLGSVLNNFKDKDLLYVIGREMGHCAAGHALWRTVMQFMTGKRQFNRNLMGEGILQYLNPTKIVESAVDVPLMAWSRHAEITADRAGSLVVGDETVVRRVCTQWALRSFPLYASLNLEALDRQIAGSDDTTTNMAEMTMTSTPYLGRRLRLARAHHESEEYLGWRRVIEHWTEPPKPPPPKPGEAAPAEEMVRLHCIACHSPMSFPRSRFGEEGVAIKVRCPSTACAKVMEIKPLPPQSALIERVARDKDLDTVKLTCVACNQPFRAPKSIMEGQTEVHIRCANPKCGKVLTIRPPAAAAPPPPAPEPAPPIPSGQNQAPELLSTDQ